MSLDSDRWSWDQLAKAGSSDQEYGVSTTRYMDKTGVVHRAIWVRNQLGWWTLCHERIDFKGGRPGLTESALENQDVMLTCITCIGSGG